MDRDHAILNELRLVRMDRFVSNVILGNPDPKETYFAQQYQDGNSDFIAASDRISRGFLVSLMGKSPDWDEIVSQFLSYLGEPDEWIHEEGTATHVLIWTHGARSDALQVIQSYNAER